MGKHSARHRGIMLKLKHLQNPLAVMFSETDCLLWEGFRTAEVVLRCGHDWAAAMWLHLKEEKQKHESRGVSYLTRKKIKSFKFTEIHDAAPLFFLVSRPKRELSCWSAKPESGFLWFLRPLAYPGASGPHRQALFCPLWCQLLGENTGWLGTSEWRRQRKQPEEAAVMYAQRTTLHKHEERPSMTITTPIRLLGIWRDQKRIK